MPAYIEELRAQLQAALGERVRLYDSLPDEVAIETDAAALLETARALRDDPRLKFEMLMDLSAVDYLDYGRTEWRTNAATITGFSRGVNRGRPAHPRERQALCGGLPAAVDHAQPPLAAAGVV